MEQRFDPMTGQPIIKNEAASSEINFDPMTGQPIIKTETAPSEMNFDPMTGLPIIKTETAPSKMSFDPMTGQPIERGISANPGMPIKQGKGKAMGILIALGVIVVIASLALIGIRSGVFLKPSKKVLLAAVNTLQDQPRFIKDLSSAKVNDLLNSGKYTIEVSSQFEDFDVDILYLAEPSKMQLTGNVESRLIDIDFIAEMTSDQIRFKIPVKDRRMFTYNYREEKDGAIVDMVGDSMLTEIDNALIHLNSGNQNKDLSKDMIKVLQKEYDTLKFKSLDKKDFTIDEKKRSCKGYSATISPDHLENIIDGIEEIWEDAFDETFRAAELRPDQAFDELRYGLRYMDDIRLECYLYRNKLAAIILESDDDDVQIQLLFEGGDTRMQNMRCIVSEYDDVAELQLKGRIQDSEERYSLKAKNKYDSYDLAELRYDYKSGAYRIQAGEGDYDEIMLKGTIKSDRNGLTLTLDQIDVYGIPEITGSLSVKKGSSIQEISGDEYDIGEASYFELLGWVNEYRSLLSGAIW